MEDLQQLKKRIDKLEQQRIPYTLDQPSISSLNDKSRKYIKELSIAEGNGILIDNKNLVDGDNIISGLNGDITKYYRLVIDVFIDDTFPSGNYIAFNNNITDDGFTFIQHYSVQSAGSASQNVNGHADFDRIILLNQCTFAKCRYHVVIDFDMNRSTEAANRRLIYMEERAGNNGGAFTSTSCYSVSYSRPNLTSLNIHFENSISYGKYKLYKVIR